MDETDPGCSPIPENLGTTLLTCLTLLTASLIILGAGASAQEQVNSVTPYSWISSGGDNVDFETNQGGSHEWFEVTSSTGENEIPAVGLHLVRVSWDHTDQVEQIRFRYAEDGGTDEVSRVFRFDQDESSADNQWVHLANTNVMLGDDTTTGTDGCDDDGFPPSTGGTTTTCWFFVETFDQNDPDSTVFGTTAAPYTLSVRLEEGGGSSLTNWEDFDTSNVLPVELDTSVESFSFAAEDEVELSSGEVGVEAGEPTRLNATLSMNQAITERSTQPDWNTGDIDVWICLYREDISNPQGPYEGFPDLVTLLDPNNPNPWDEPADCEFNQFPTHDQGAVDDGNAAGKELTPFSDRDKTRSDSDVVEQQERYFTNSFTFEFEEDQGNLETESGSWVDEFYFRVIVRDSWGNVDVNTYDGNTDSTSGSASGPFTAAIFDASQEPQTFTLDSSPDVSDFKDRDECFAPTGDAGSEGDPCYRSLDHAPPNQPITFPITLSNAGSVTDTVKVNWQHQAGEQAGWSVELVDPATESSVSGDQLPMEVDVQAGSPNSPNTKTIEARMTPGAQTIAKDPGPNGSPNAPASKEIQLWAWSGRTLDQNAEQDARDNDPAYLQAHLVQRDVASLSWGDGGTNDHQLSMETQAVETVGLTLENKGNNEGPFQPELDTSAPSHDVECTLNPSGIDADAINLEVQSGGTRLADGEVVLPGDTADLAVEVEVGSQVPIGTYDCVFGLTNTESDEDGDQDSGDIDVPLSPSEPTLTVEVVGTPAINVIDAHGSDRKEVDVTGDEVTMTVPPTEDLHDVYLYLENTGDVALDPQLDSDMETFRVQDPLPGTWLGVPDESNQGNTISLSEADDAFTLPVSDQNDTGDIHLRDLFPTDTTTGGSQVSDNPWTCQGDDGLDDNDDRRIICRLHFRFDLTGKHQVTGDEVVYNFTWQDVDAEADPSTVTLRLQYGHVGTVEATEVTKKVIGTDDSPTVDFEATLGPSHRFDPDEQQVDARVRATFQETDGSSCSAMDTGQIQSVSESLRSATFRPSLSVSEGGCDVSVSGGTVDLTVPTDSTGLADVQLEVKDENGTQLRQIHPVEIRVDALKSSVDEPNAPSSFELSPSDELDATGTQFARLAFDPGSGDRADYPAGGEGVLLTRKSEVNELTPFPRCNLDSAITTDGSDGLQWRALQPNPEDVENGVLASEHFESGVSQPTVDADTLISGAILREDTNADDTRARQIGEITMWGWGDTSNLEWTEGWNPVVLRVTDRDGDPAQTGEDGDLQLELGLSFVKRESATNWTITDAYELSSQDDTIRLRGLGHGFVAADIYLPSTIGEDEGGDWLLGDSTSTQQSNVQSIDYEAFGLHASISSGQSDDGDDLRGDAYWQLDDLGMIDDKSGDAERQWKDREIGTAAASEIRAGIQSSRDRLSGQSDLDPEQDTIDFLHTAPHFVEPLMQARERGSAADWVTGNGVQDYGLFLLEETQSPEDNPRGFDSGNVSSTFKDHTFDPFTDATVSFQTAGLERVRVPGGDHVQLKQSDEQNGFYSGFFVLRDQGLGTFEWFTELDVDDQNGNVASVVRNIRADSAMEPSTNGLPMPLCLRSPDGAVTESDDDAAGDFDLDTREIRRIVDLRTVPGLLVDRGGFAMAPLIENDQGGVHFDVNPDATFNVVGESLLSLSASQLPTSGETGRDIPITVSPTPTSAVSEVTATLRLNGTTEDTATLVGPDSDGDWSGSVTPPEAGSYTLRVSATDTGGGVEAVSSTVEVQANSPPSITIVDPAEVEGERAMPSDGEIEATIADNLITADAITLEEKIGSSDGQQGTVLSDADVTFDSLTDQPTVGEHSITVNFSDVETGTAHVNVTGMPGENMTASISSNESSGTIQFNETGTATVTVQTNGTDGVDTSFDVQVQSAGGDDFSEVDLGSDAISCEGTTCTLSYAPSGLSDGDTYTFKILANISEDDKSTKGPIDVTVDDETPSVSISIGTPKGSGSPTRVGTQTSLTVEAEDNVMIESVILGARKGGVEAGTRSFEGGQASVTGDVSSLSQLGLDSSGTASLNATVIDIAGNEDTARVEVRIDGEGPSLSDAALEAQGAGLQATLSVSDPAGIDVVQLLVKKPGETTFTGRTMQQESGSTYTGSVSSPGNSGTLEYYFRATDDLGNEQTLGSEANPRTFDLSSVSLENAPPEVSIVSPGPDERVSGTFDLTLELSDPDAGDTVEVESVLLTPSSGDEVSVDLPSELSGDDEVTVPVDTTDVAEGRTIVEVEVSDGTDTSTAQQTVFVDNLLDPCQDSPAVSGGEVTFCLTFTPAGNVSDVQMELVRNGETVATAPAECDGSVCRATFPEGDVPDDAPVRPDLVVTTEDGQTQRHEGEIQSLGGALSPDEPLGRFVTTLVLGVATMGAAAYAGFRRWG